MKENAILAYLKREPAEFNIDDFMAMLNFDMLLTHEEELPLITQAQQGDTEAMARQYVANHIPLQQLIQAGVQGLEQAIMEYKPESEKLFIKFAVPVMRDVINRYIGEAVKQYDTTGEMSLKAFAEPSVRVAMQGIINGGA